MRYLAAAYKLEWYSILVFLRKSSALRTEVPHIPEQITLVHFENLGKEKERYSSHETTHLPVSKKFRKGRKADNPVPQNVLVTSLTESISRYGRV